MINLLPPRQGWALQRMAPMGFLVLLALMWTGVLGLVLGFMQGTILRMVAAGFGWDYIAWLFGIVA